MPAADRIDKELTPVNIPLNGKCVTAVDPSAVGLGNFQSLVNLRLGETNPEPIQGMTKINETTALANVNITKGIQFRKEDPSTESHVIVHAYDLNGANGKVYRNSATIPNQGDFEATELFSDSAGAGTPRFNLAPLGHVVYCNGTDSAIWPGQEGKCVGYTDYHPDRSYMYHYTRQVTNDLTDSDNLATVHRYADTADANTMLLLHLDNDVTDSSPTTVHTVTNIGVTFSISEKKFGTHGAYFGGATTYFTIPDDADFDLSGGTWTIDFWMKWSTISAGETVFFQRTDDSNYVQLYFVDTSTMRFKIVAAAATVVQLDFARPFTGWHHIAIVENGDDYYAFVDGSLAGYVSDADRATDYTQVVTIGASNFAAGAANFITAYIDELRVSSSARWTSAFEPPTQAYGSGNIHTSYVGASLPAQGINWYVQTANATVGSVAVYYWDGSTWTTVGAVSGVGATPWSATGKNTWTFPTTVATAKPRVINGGMAYWYKVVVTEPDTTTQFYKVTLNCPMQPIKDLWDGAYQKISSFQKYQSSTYNDFTTGVFEDTWDASNAATFVEIDSLPTGTAYLYFGFTERQQALRIALIGGHVNTTAGTVMTMEYWNGTEWTSLGAVDDETVEGGVSFAKSGIVMWNPPSLENEFETDLPGTSGNRPNLYYYRISFSKTLSADVQLYFVGGIPSQKAMKNYNFGVHHLGRLWLAKGNEIVASATGTAQVFNGDDYLEFTVGGDTDVVGATSLTARVGSSIYAVLLLFKKSEIWLLVGSTQDNMVGPLLITSSIGLTAPDTLVVIPSYELGPGISRPIAVWQGSDAVYMSDGFSVNPISDTIADRFDDRKNTRINRTYISSSFGAYDEKYGVYHWNYAEGAATAPDNEWGYKFKRNGWFEIDRTAAKRLKAMIPVEDSSGNSYMYGAIQGGYLMRLENGPTFDGVNIGYTMWTGNHALVEGNLAVESQVRGIKLVMKANNDTANTVAVTHYVDGDTTGKPVTAMAPQQANRGVASVYRSVSFDAVLHSTKFVLSSDLGGVGFEPLFLSYYIKPWRLDKGFSAGDPVT